MLRLMLWLRFHLPPHWDQPASTHSRSVYFSDFQLDALLVVASLCFRLFLSLIIVNSLGNIRPIQFLWHQTSQGMENSASN